MIGSCIGSTLGWMVGERAGLMTALMLSVAGSGLGWIGVQSLLRRFLD